jgi:hypothetical protein
MRLRRRRIFNIVVACVGILWSCDRMNTQHANVAALKIFHLILVICAAVVCGCAN